MATFPQLNEALFRRVRGGGRPGRFLAEQGAVQGVEASQQGCARQTRSRRGWVESSDGALEHAVQLYRLLSVGADSRLPHRFSLDAYAYSRTAEQMGHACTQPRLQLLEFLGLASPKSTRSLRMSRSTNMVSDTTSDGGHWLLGVRVEEAVSTGRPLCPHNYQGLASACISSQHS